jgi:hypothetical protein
MQLNLDAQVGVVDGALPLLSARGRIVLKPLPMQRRVATLPMKPFSSAKLTEEYLANAGRSDDARETIAGLARHPAAAPAPATPRTPS